MSTITGNQVKTMLDTIGTKGAQLVDAVKAMGIKAVTSTTQAENSEAQQAQRLMKAQEQAKQKQINESLKKIAEYRATLQKESENSARKAYINQMMAQRTARNSLSRAGLGNTGYRMHHQRALDDSYQQALKEIKQSRKEGMAQLDEQEDQVWEQGASELQDIYDAYKERFGEIAQVTNPLKNIANKAKSVAVPGWEFAKAMNGAVYNRINK